MCILSIGSRCGGTQQTRRSAGQFTTNLTLGVVNDDLMPVRFFDRSSDSSDGDSLTGGYLCSHCETRFCNYCLIRFLRGLLINHDTQPQPIAIQSKPIAPGSVLNAALSRTQRSLIDSLSVHKVRRNSQKTNHWPNCGAWFWFSERTKLHQIVSDIVGLKARPGTLLLR